MTYKRLIVDPIVDHCKAQRGFLFNIWSRKGCMITRVASSSFPLRLAVGKGQHILSSWEDYKTHLKLTESVFYDP